MLTGDSRGHPHPCPSHVVHCLTRRPDRCQSPVAVSIAFPQYVSPQIHHILLRVCRLEDLEPNSSRSVIAYLGGGAIPGVGPVTARRMVAGLGDTVLEILDSPGEPPTWQTVVCSLYMLCFRGEVEAQGTLSWFSMCKAAHMPQLPAGPLPLNQNTIAGQARRRCCSGAKASARSQRPKSARAGPPAGARVQLKNSCTTWASPWHRRTRCKTVTMVNDAAMTTARTCSCSCKSLRQHQACSGAPSALHMQVVRQLGVNTGRLVREDPYRAMRKGAISFRYPT